MWLLEPFDEKIRSLKLAGYWLVFLITGIVLKELLTPLSPAFIEVEKEIIINFCQPVTILEVTLAPVLETSIFMILPYLWKRKKGAIVGISVWAILHLLSKNIPIFIYICIMSIFYFKAISAKKYKEVVIFHGLINWPVLLSCL